jgi:ssDNA-binding Zn-finger/Zn-ribbon topoisomerase 1
MNNYSYPIGADSSDAPWNEDIKLCPICDSQMMITDSGKHKNFTWYSYECNCGYTCSNEPDYD